MRRRSVTSPTQRKKEKIMDQAKARTMARGLLSVARQQLKLSSNRELRPTCILISPTTTKVIDYEIVNQEQKLRMWVKIADEARSFKGLELVVMVNDVKTKGQALTEPLPMRGALLNDNAADDAVLVTAFGPDIEPFCILNHWSVVEGQMVFGPESEMNGVSGDMIFNLEPRYWVGLHKVELKMVISDRELDILDCRGTYWIRKDVHALATLHRMRESLQRLIKVDWKIDGGETIQ
jgi:hypothetical protein